MNEHRHDFSLVLMCRVLKLARSGFYHWLHQPISERAKEDARLVEAIRHSYSASGGVYGNNRVFGDLLEAGETCGRICVARLMQVNKIEAVRGYKAPRRIAGRPSIIAPNRLNREIHRRCAGPILGHRYHLHPNMAALALPGICG